MAISFTCDCGSALEATDDFAGRTGSCPACGRDVLVPNPAPLERRRGRRLLWSCVAVLVAVLGGILALAAVAKYRQSAGDTAAASVADEDPRWAFPTPFRNTRPDVAYVRDGICAECHVDQATDFHKHPMGQSLFPVASVAGLQRYDATVRNPFEALGATFEVERLGDGVFHKETRRDSHGKLLAEARAEVHYVLGSGVHNYSYLIDRGGYLVQSPITFYSQKNIWDISPGLENYGRNLFERPVASDCLFCHANRVAAVPDTLNRFEPPIFIDGTVIGCQRCHGPGALHVERRERGEVVDGPDHTIVNPRWLPSELRAGICHQCHLEGVRRILKRGRDSFDYRPGLPWQMFWTVFARTDLPDDSKLVSSVEQLYVSRCFQASKGKMGCTSCHEPHRLPEATKRTDFYRGRCQS